MDLEYLLLLQRLRESAGRGADAPDGACQRSGRQSGDGGGGGLCLLGGGPAFRQFPDDELLWAAAC